LLAPDLQGELGSAQALGERWKDARVTGVSVEPRCVGIGVDVHVVKMQASVIRHAGASARSFELGTAAGACGREQGLPVTANVSGGKITALRLQL